MSSKKTTYSDYLQLDKILDGQNPLSSVAGKPIHDETLFIIIHQIYELWFKQIIHEINSIINHFSNPSIEEMNINIVVSRLSRIHDIQKIALSQIDILKSMTPMDFLEFRDLLNPASGFQSAQFRVIENALGLKKEKRLKFNKQNYIDFLSKPEKELVKKYENIDSIFDLIQTWLERTPFLESEEFNFWKSYKNAIRTMLDDDMKIINDNPNLTLESKNEQISNYENIYKNYECLFNEKEYKKLIQSGRKRLSQKASLAALFIMLYRDEPILQAPFRLLTKLIDIDQALNSWRYNHALLAQRMIGTKIGSGGSSGAKYLTKTLEKHSIFDDYANLSTYLIPKSALPELPKTLKNKLGYYFINE
tara:strand:- start:3442 stop:4530 length:1089 start_codon:yes stop_codon:yes gene_type:complete